MEISKQKSLTTCVICLKGLGGELKGFINILLTFDVYNYSKTTQLGRPPYFNFFIISNGSNITDGIYIEDKICYAFSKNNFQMKVAIKLTL